jgi:adenosylcobinamide-GDP ribazoletransferase
VISLLIGLTALGWWVAPFVLVTAAGAGLIGLLAQRNIGGFTGDVLGAAQQVGEVSLLVLGAALTSPGLVEGAWWR